MIPPRIHFVWFGSALPFFARVAIQSALNACPQADVQLWAEADLALDPELSQLASYPRFSLTRLSEQELVEGASMDEVRKRELRTLVAGLRTPAARANIARLLILERHGGIYLDTDTLTLRDLSPLLSLSAFCGEEHVVWPREHTQGVSRYRLWGGPLREVVRFGCAHLPDGERLFSRVQSWYARAGNNAVLGFAPQHPFLGQLLEAAFALDPSERYRRYRLGTHLLQEGLRAPCAPVVCFAPSYFYPLGPEISRHYFHVRHDAAAASDRLLAGPAHVLHWYGSIAQLTPYDAARIRREQSQTLFAQLCARVLDTQGALAGPRALPPAARSATGLVRIGSADSWQPQGSPAPIPA